MPRQPFAPIRQRKPGGQFDIGLQVIDRRPKLQTLIGGCLMMWPPVEAEMALLLGHLLGASNPAALAVFHFLRRSSSQREAISEAAAASLGDGDQELVAAVLHVHKSIEEGRNALAHGHFGIYSELPDDILWMTTGHYVELRAALHLSGERFSEDRQRRLYSNISVYREKDIEEVVEAIKYCGLMWTELRFYLREKSPRRRSQLYDRLCNQSRIAQALATLRQKNSPSTPPQ